MNVMMVKEKKNFVNLLFRRDISSSSLYGGKKTEAESQHGSQSIKSTLAKYHEKPVSKEDVEGFRNRGFSYLGFYGGISNYSKAIDIKRYSDGKVGRPRKHANDSRFSNSKKRKRCQKQCINEGIQMDSLSNSNVLDSLPPSTTVNEVLDIIEKRKQSIKAKISVKKEHLLTREEEQDIHTRADIYAITTAPDPNYYVASQDEHLTRPTVSIDESRINTVYPTAKKKRRRNYGNSNCYVTYHSTDDIFDNTKMLPLGTRLLKPPTKLVELVAQAIDGSPDGLLQVQQIYTFLQNRYPFFRYMERSAINSWRSSIRHALYQKWFRKIRFDLSYISCKGCYWAINHKTNPKEWTMPDSSIWLNTDEDCYPLGGLDIGSITHTDVLALLRDENSDGDSGEGVIAVAREFGIDLEDPFGVEDGPNQHAESPVRELDPVLATCAPGLLNEDIYLSSTQSSGNESPLVNNPSYFQYSDSIQPNDSYPSKTDEINSTNQPRQQEQPNRQNQGRKVQRVNKPSVLSPIVNWTPNWEEYGSYILSPQSVSSQQHLFGVQLGKPENTSGYRERRSLLESKNNYKSVIEDVNFILANSPSTNVSNSTSDIGSDVEVIAEFTKSSSESSFEDPEDFYLLDV